MGIMEDINKKDNLPGILSDVANAFIRAGTDDLEDELDKKNKGMHLKYTVSKDYKLSISFFNGQKEESCDIDIFDALPLIKLNLLLERFYNGISLNYAEFDIDSGHIKLYFQSDETNLFDDFKKQIDMEDVEVICVARTQETHITQIER